MKVVYLTHGPHEVHLNFAKRVNAEVKTINLHNLINLQRKYPFIKYIYPVISLLYIPKLDEKTKVLLVDGWAFMYIAAFLKIQHPDIKIIYLDADLFMHNFNLGTCLGKKLNQKVIDKIDGIISVSELNKKAISSLTKAPIYVCSPYPKKIKKMKIKRKNCGLYVGRLDPDKNIDRIIEFGIQCPFLEKMIVIGDGNLKNYVKKMSDKYPKLIYLGKKKDPSKYYNQCKFLIHIPNADPHPCTTIEAAIVGCFPIVSEGVGSKYLFDKLFIVKNPDNFEEINNKIKFILNNEEKAKKILKKSLKKILTKEKALAHFKKTFNKLLNEKRKNSNFP